MALTNLSLRECVNVFATGFAITRSLKHPFVVSKIGDLIVMGDNPPRKHDPRNSEIIVFDIPIKQAVEQIRALSLPKYKLCVIHRLDEDRNEIREEYKLHGFRLLGTEPAFARIIRNEKSSGKARRIVDQVTADKIAKVNRRRVVIPGWFEQDISRIRLYASIQDDSVIGWVKSVPTNSHCSWVSDLYVIPEFRGQGYGKALMQTMLADDERLGIRRSYLLASREGALLYPRIGYEEIGLLQFFTPVR